jgi:hypothetical protein
MLLIITLKSTPERLDPMILNTLSIPLTWAVHLELWVFNKNRMYLITAIDNKIELQPLEGVELRMSSLSLIIVDTKSLNH